MPNYWLLKSEPTVYSYADLERDQQTVWDGVANNAALMYIRQVAVGDLAFIYHTGNERCAVGIAEVTSPAYPDPKEYNPKLLVFDVRALRQLPQPIRLEAVKADPYFADFALVRQGRLSVVPVSAEQWRRLLMIAGVDG
jgi:predicted RNA-binding protein with PUA-like domain